MLKKLFLLLVVLPPSFVSADEINSSQIDNNSSDSATNSEKMPRSTDYFFSQCFFAVPPVVVDNDPLPLNQRPISINSNRIYSIDNKLSFEGDVELTQGIKTLKADKLTYSQDDQTASAQGNINLVTGDITLNSDSIETQLSNDQTTMKQVDYQFHGQGGRGNAEQIYDNGANFYELNSSSYSACPPGDQTWSISASTLYIDNEEGVASAYNAVLRIKDVPVLYLPYITYPTSDKRKTGLLFPTYEFADTNGFTFTQPLYINITDNLDATLTPVYMENRGTMVKGEFRYLFDFGEGKFATEYLENDKIYDDTRYLNHWEHSLSLTKNWSFSSNYTRVSDDDYLDDIDTDYGTYTDSQLLQTAKLGYSQASWESELEVRDFQVLNADADIYSCPLCLVPF